MSHVLDFPPAKIYSPVREEWRMRGEVERQRSMLSVVDAEHCVPEDHPIRRIKTLANAELARLSPTFDAIYAEGGRPSIPPERLLKALLLIALYSVRSERQLCEQLHYNLLFRFFLDLVHPEIEEEAEQEVVVQLLAELALAAHAVEGNQQQRLEQALWRDGWPTPLRIDRVEGRRQARELRIGKRLDAPNRMVLRHAVLGIDNAEHRSLPLDFSPHPPLLPHRAIDLRRREVEHVAHFSAPC